MSYENPSFVAPITMAQVAEALEELEREVSSYSIGRYVECLRLAIERTELLRHAPEDQAKART